MSPSARRSLDAGVLAVALALGLAIGWVDSRPHWDDTGITAGLLFLSAAAVTFLVPRRPWLCGIAIGAGVWLEFVRTAMAKGHPSFAGVALEPLVPLVFPMAGAYGAYFLRRVLSATRPGPAS